MRDIDVLRYAERNHLTEADHKKEVLWQITLPFILGVLLILTFGGLVIAAAVRGTQGVSVWADISLIWLIIPALVVTLIFSAILLAILYLLVRLIHILPRYTFKVQSFLTTVQSKVIKYSDVAAEPVMKAKTWSSALRALFRQGL